MLWVPCYKGIRRGGNLSPLLFPINGYSEVLIKATSDGAESDWWLAGWLNILVQDASLPTFQAISFWQRVPLGSSLVQIPGPGTYTLQIDPAEWLQDLSVSAWGNSQFPEVLELDGGVY